MYMRFNNLPCLVTEDGTPIDSVRDWVFQMAHSRGFRISSVERYVTSLNLFYTYCQIYPLESDSDDAIEDYTNNFLDAMIKGDRRLGWKAYSSSAVALAQEALYSYLAYDKGRDLMKEQVPLDRFAAAYRKKGLLGYLDSPETKKRFKRIVRRELSEAKYFPPELFWDFYDLLDSPRDKSLFLLMVGTSARVSQALNIWQRDILFDERRVVFTDPRDRARKKELKEKYGLEPDPDISSKSDLPGIWLPGPFKEEFFNQARLYFQQEYVPIGKRFPEHPYFFITRPDGNRLRPPFVRDKFSQTAVRLGLTDLGPHSLRHTFGFTCHVHLGMSIVQIADYMGHKSLESTRIYTRIPTTEAESIFKEKFDRLVNRHREEGGSNEREAKGIKFMKGERKN